METYIKEVEIEGIKEPRLYTRIENLHRWEDNPFLASQKGLDRLAAQLDDLETYKPVLVLPDGTIIAGNKRYSYYKSRGDSEIWISILKIRDKNDILKINLSDNDTVGFASDNALANLLPGFEIDLSNYAVQFDDTAVTLADIVKEGEQPDQGGKFGGKEVTCPGCNLTFVPTKSSR